MATIDTIEITDEDRKRWPYMDNDGGRQAMKHVANQTTDRLLDCVAFDRDGSFDHSNDNMEFRIFANEFGQLNLSWLSARIAEELYERRAIDETKLDQIMGH